MSNDTWNFYFSDPLETRRNLMIDISNLHVEQARVKIFFAFEGGAFHERNSVTFNLGNGLNAILLPEFGVERLSLDLIDLPNDSIVVNEVITANYFHFSFTISFWAIYAVIVLVIATVLYIWFFMREQLYTACSLVYKKLKEMFKESELYKVGCKSEKNRYIIAALFVAMLMALTYLFVPIHFYNIDDAINMYIVAGYDTGTPSPLLLYSNILFGYMMSGLYTLMPMLPWYGIMHVFFIYFSQLMILKSLLRVAAQRDVTAIVSLGLYFVLYAFFLIFSTVRLQFTTTPAMMGAAACVVAASLFTGESKRVRFFDIISIVFLILFSFIIRWNSGDGVIRFFLVVMLIKAAMTFLTKDELKHKLRRTCVYAAIGICVAVTIVTAREINLYMLDTNGLREFHVWNGQWARFRNHSRAHFDVEQELYESIGWDRNLHDLVLMSFTMDERVTIESFTILNEFTRDAELTHSFLYRVVRATGLSWSFVVDNPVPRSAANVLMVVALVHITLLVNRMRNNKQSRWEDAISILFTLAIIGGFLASLLWLSLGGFSVDAIGGRINQRAFLVPLMPAACLVVWNVLYIWGSALQRGVKQHRLIAITLCFVIGLYFIQVPFRTISDTATSPHLDLQVERRMNREQYAMDNPESVFIMNVLLARTPVPVFTTYREVKPTNLMSLSAEMSPNHIEQRRINGIDEFGASIFLRPGFYYIDSSTQGLFFRYMQSRYNAFSVVTDQFDNVFVIRFIELEQFLSQSDEYLTLHHIDSILAEPDIVSVYVQEFFHDEPVKEDTYATVLVYDQPISMSENTNYLIMFDVETESEPESFWVEWYSVDQDFHIVRHAVREFEIESGHNSHFGTIYTGNNIFDENTRFRIIVAPTSNMEITNFTIIEVCGD